MAKMMARKPEDRYQTPGEVAKALVLHAQDKTQSPRVAQTVLEMPVPHPPRFQAVAKTLVENFTPSESPFAAIQPNSEREVQRKAPATIWIGLVAAVGLGALALLGIIVGVIVLVANKNPSEAKKTTPPATTAQSKPNDKQDDSKRDPKEQGKDKADKPDPKEKGKDKADKPIDDKPIPQFPASLEIDLGDGVKLEFVLLNAKGNADFRMGATDSEDGLKYEKPRHNVTLTKPFYSGKYPVTQEQYAKLTGDKPSWFQVGKGGADKLGNIKDTSRFPVENVFWDNADAFCKTLMEKHEGKVPASLRQQKYRFSLPTEAQWEYACRAGTSTAYYCGNNPKDLGEYACWRDNASNRTHEVGTKKANSWDLYDMNGNVWQWCEDYYDENFFASGGNKDPLNIKFSGSHVLRGGSWNNEAKGCRAACRTPTPPDGRFGCGFRVALRAD